LVIIASSAAQALWPWGKPPPDHSQTTGKPIIVTGKF